MTSDVGSSEQRTVQRETESEQVGSRTDTVERGVQVW
jgi:hypothetical protein